MAIVRSIHWNPFKPPKGDAGHEAPCVPRFLLQTRGLVAQIKMEDSHIGVSIFQIHLYPENQVDTCPIKCGFSTDTTQEKKKPCMAQDCKDQNQHFEL